MIERPSLWLSEPSSLLYMFAAVAFTLLCGRLGKIIYLKIYQWPILHPSISGAILVALGLYLADIDYPQYFANSELFTYLLGPATVAMAIPLYQQLHLIREMTKPLLLTVLIGGSFASLSALGLAWLFGADNATLMSVIPKSVTTPIAIGISEEIGGIMAITTITVIFTGAAGMSMAPTVFKMLSIEDPRIQGFCYGLVAHAVGTARSFEINITTGAFASLALCLTGTFSAIVIPLAVVAWNTLTTF